MASAYIVGTDVLGAAAAADPADEAREVGDRTVAEAQAFDRVLESGLQGISDRAWTDFVYALKVAEPGAVSDSNEHGMFAMKPRRLADLGVMGNLRCTRAPTGPKRMVWVGDFVKPMTREKFLASPGAQYKALCDSMRAYVRGLSDGSVPNPAGGRPADMTLSGALAVLHKCGPSGLKSWNDEGDRFPATVALYDKTNGIF